MAGPSQVSHSVAVTGSYSNVGSVLAGNNISGGNFVFNSGGAAHSDADISDECLSALFSTNPEDDRAKRIGKKGLVTPGTCSWIAENETYKTWKHESSQNSRLLWISGGPGMGKTMLSIYITHELEAWSRHSSNTIVLYYCCDGQDKNCNNPANILRGLIYQLLQKEKTLIKLLLGDYRVQKAKLFEFSALEALWRIFQAMIQESNFEMIYCVIDGLDECDVEHLPAFLTQLHAVFDQNSSEFHRMPSRYRSTRRPITRRAPISGATRAAPSSEATPQLSGPKFRLIIASREEPACLQKELGSFPRVLLSARSEALDNGGFRKYLDAKAQDISHANNNTSAAGYFASALQKQGDGSFLWVDIATERLKKAGSTPAAEIIKTLPSTIEGLYCQALLEIPDTLAKLATLTLWSVALASRPLKIEELEIVLSLDPQTAVNRPLLLHVIEQCGSLLVFRNNEVTLGHQILKSLLLRPASAAPAQDMRLRKFEVDPELGHVEMTKTCIKYLEQVFRPVPSFYGSKASAKILRVISSNKTPLSADEQEQLARFPFLEYAVMNWTSHAKASRCGTSMFAMPFFEPKSPARQIWLDVYWISTHKVTSKYLTPSSFTLLHIAAYFGILPLAIHIEQQGLLRAQFAIRNNYASRPLNLAIEQVQPVMARFLLDRGAQKVPRDAFDQYYTLVWEASAYGDAETLSLLLQMGEDPNQPFPTMNVTAAFKVYSGCATRYMPALIHGYSEKKLMSEWRASRYAYGDHESPLHAASIRGHQGTAEVLLNARARVDSRTTGGWTPLHCAAFYGKPDVIVLLLSRGADVHAETSRDQFTPLHLAAEEGHLYCADELVGFNANLERKSSKGRTPLHIASKTGHNKIVALLLDNGADIEALAQANSTPLILAAFYGQESTVKLLLKRGANRHTVDESGKSALDWAISRSNFSIEEILRNYDPLVHTDDEFEGTQLEQRFTRTSISDSYMQNAGITTPIVASSHVYSTQSESSQQQNFTQPSAYHFPGPNPASTSSHESPRPLYSSQFVPSPPMIQSGSEYFPDRPTSSRTQPEYVAQPLISPPTPPPRLSSSALPLIEDSYFPQLHATPVSPFMQHPANIPNTAFLYGSPGIPPRGIQQAGLPAAPVHIPQRPRSSFHPELPLQYAPPPPQQPTHPAQLHHPTYEPRAYAAAPPIAFSPPPQPPPPPTTSTLATPSLRKSRSYLDISSLKGLAIFGK